MFLYLPVIHPKNQTCLTSGALNEQKNKSAPHFLSEGFPRPKVMVSENGGADFQQFIHVLISLYTTPAFSATSISLFSEQIFAQNRLKTSPPFKQMT
jgi:hypothetical protein